MDQSRSELKAEEVLYNGRKARLRIDRELLIKEGVTILYVGLRARQTVRPDPIKDPKKLHGAFPGQVKLHVFGPGVASLRSVDIPHTVETMLAV